MLMAKKKNKHKILIKKGDEVAVIAGKDKNKKGKVLKVLPNENRLIVENINLRKRHVKPKKQGQKGQTVETAAPLHISNVMLVCKNCGSKTRIAKKILEDKNKIKNKSFVSTPLGRNENEFSFRSSLVKIRICKKCGGEL